MPLVGEEKNKNKNGGGPLLLSISLSLSFLDIIFLVIFFSRVWCDMIQSTLRGQTGIHKHNENKTMWAPPQPGGGPPVAQGSRRSPFVSSLLSILRRDAYTRSSKARSFFSCCLFFFFSPGLFHTIPPVRPVLLEALNLGEASIPALSTPTHWIHVDTALHPAEVRRRRSFDLCCRARRLQQNAQPRLGDLA